MIRIDPLPFLIILQLLLVFMVATFYLAFRKAKIGEKELNYRGQIVKLKDELAKLHKKYDTLPDWEGKFHDAQSKFNDIKTANTNIRESILSLIPESEQSDDFKKIISDLDNINTELTTCIDTLEKDNEDLGEQTASLQASVHELTMELDEAISKPKYERVLLQKNQLASKLEVLLKDLVAKEKAYDSLQKNYDWLENEYNRLYQNVHSEKPQ